MSDFEADFDGAALAEAWRAHRREGLRHLVVTGRDGATLGTVSTRVRPGARLRR